MIPIRVRAMLASAFAATLLSGCVAPVGPVEVTRFHVPDLAALGHGGIAVVPAAGMDGSSLEWKSYQAAVARQLALLGYSEMTAPSADGQVAELRLSRQTYRPDKVRNPVSVGVGGSTGSYGSGIGLGIGLDLSGAPPQQTETRLGVLIKDKPGGTALWEGRAAFTVRADSPLAQTQLGAAKIAEALFKGFPGQSGETIEVK